MRMSCRIATLNPMTEITNPARPIQSPTSILIGSPTVIFEKGSATFTLFLGATTLGAERDLGARAVPLSSAIPQPPISRPDGAAMCVYAFGLPPPRQGRQALPSREPEPNLTCQQALWPNASGLAGNVRLARRIRR